MLFDGWILLTARGICLLAQVEWWCKPTFWLFILVCIVPYIYQLQILLFGNSSGSNLVLIHIQPLQYSEILAVPFDTTDGDKKKGGSPSARSSRLRRVRGRVRPLGSFVRSLSLHFCKRLFPGLEPVTSWSQGSSFTTAPISLTDFYSNSQKCI